MALKGSQMEMTNSVIWVRLSATLSPLEGLFPVYIQAMSHFSGIPDTVGERMSFDWASYLPHLCKAMVIPITGRHSDALQNTRGDQNMEENIGNATYSAYPFIHLTIEGITVKINTKYSKITHSAAR